MCGGFGNNQSFLSHTESLAVANTKFSAIALDQKLAELESKLKTDNIYSKIIIDRKFEETCSYVDGKVNEIFMRISDANLDSKDFADKNTLNVKNYLHRFITENSNRIEFLQRSIEKLSAEVQVLQSKFDAVSRKNDETRQ